MPFAPCADASSFYWLMSGRRGGKCLQQRRGLPEHCSLVSKRQHRLKPLGGFPLSSTLHRAFFLNLGTSNGAVQDVGLFDHKRIRLRVV